uniref:THAP-type domain-containing protein n=1 Tax=Clastoptera arizonana TaxID=38151 RepID=A0A1B6EA71_9HEMI
MTKTCIVKKILSLEKKTRSYFRFPTKYEARKKWMDAIGRSRVGKGTHICSDHFDQHSFRGSLERKRLHPNAVPMLEGNKLPSLSCFASYILSLRANNHWFELFTSSSKILTKGVHLY